MVNLHTFRVCFVSGMHSHHSSFFSRHWRKNSNLTVAKSAVIKKPKLPSTRRQNCFRFTTLLYLHSNYCSPTVICALKKKKRRFISKRHTGSGGHGRHWQKGRRAESSAKTSSSLSRLPCSQRLSEAIQTLTVPANSNTTCQIVCRCAFTSVPSCCFPISLAIASPSLLPEV